MRNAVVYKIGHPYGGIELIKGCMGVVYDKGKQMGVYSSLNILNQDGDDFRLSVDQVKQTVNIKG